VHLWGRRRTALAALSTVALAAGLGVATASLAAAETTAGADPMWTITFRTAGAACTSRPDPPNLTVEVGTSVALVNETGEAALLDAGYKRPPTVADGESYVLRLKLGANVVRMVPQCPGSGEAEAATIYVEMSPVSAGPGPDRSTTAQTAAGAAPGPAAGPSTVIRPVDTSRPASGSPSPFDPRLNVPRPPVLGVAPQRGIPNPIGDNSDRKGVELVGVVALICILGVGVGIIRVIRARHANSAQ